MQAGSAWIVAMAQAMTPNSMTLVRFIALALRTMYGNPTHRAASN
jgi:hypothetical protein